jgi:21S rRNA (GM2251-2'-O)-methyltransferase
LVDNVSDRRSDSGRRYNKFDDRRSASNTFSNRYGKFDDKRRASNTHSNKYNKFDDNRSASNTIADIYDKFDDNVEGVDDEVEDEMEEGVDDPRWDNIKNKFKGVVGGRGGSERPEFRRWDRNEDWGRKTWKEATESTVPKIVGEGIYGVGPVLAALSAGRREFYALYVQQGLDLSSNNRKKKDKKGFERVLKMAEKINLSVKEASKHDLNMVADNRPHQGLVLDASPLEMVRIQELEPVSVEEGKGSLWVALDEVTDPQNLGAIIRSSYFFGATGIVLCAKNSAPLSGVVSKASAGSLELMELRFCKNMMQFLVSSAENGWRVLGGSVSSKAISLNEIEPGPPTILVLGSEGTGLRPLVERSCTQLVKIVGNIPLDLSTSELEGESTGLNGESAGKEFLSFLAVESLNVSVATGVLLHHLIGKASVDSLPDAKKQLSE